MLQITYQRTEMKNIIFNYNFFKLHLYCSSSKYVNLIFLLFQTENCIYLIYLSLYSVYLSTYLSFCLCIYWSVSVSVYLYFLSVCLSIYLSVCLSVYLPVCLSVYLFSVCQFTSVCLSLYCLYICLSQFFLSVCLSLFCLSVYFNMPVYNNVLGTLTF